ncbi:MAG: hypothetical protein JWQ81_5943 [Amycolatopsis sp.]|jgi:hypothetical protein|nr:hypothetical protein [Amycolatopsis sp.]
MNSWVTFALVVVGALILLVARWIVADWQRARRRQRFIAKQKPDWSVFAIVARVEQERADEVVVWPERDPDVIGAWPATSSEEPLAVVIPFPRSPARARQYVEVKPSPYPRTRTTSQNRHSRISCADMENSR